MSKGKHKRKKEHAETAHSANLSGSVDRETEIENGAQRKVHTGGKKDHPMRLGETIKTAFNRSSLTDWLLVVFTFVLAAAAIYQFVIMNGQLDTMRKDQRAWVSLSAGDPQIARDPASGNATISWSLVLTNTGKTLARHSSVEIVVDTVRNGESPTFAYDSGITWQTDAVVFPNTPVPIIGKMLHKTKIKDHPEQTILTPAEYQDLLDGTQYLVVYAKSSYLDIFRKEHWQHFCGFKSLSPRPINVTARDCTNYNDVDSD